MILQAKCDRCGQTGDESEIRRDYDGNDLCSDCRKAEELKQLKRVVTDKLAWLESTHLAELKKLQARITELEKT